MAKVPDSGLEISKFKLHQHFYVHFQIITIEKVMNFLIPPSYRLNSSTAVLDGWLCHYANHEGYSKVVWASRIYRLYLCRRVRLLTPNECPRYDTKQSDSETPVMLVF